ncbi:MAG: hypothetical protein EOO08_01120 [Chitinophagaceae bacterium]|nr:MAG: hypothetical protein EOO08_01120 [Chitinophagaceae bacterium]
MDAQQLEACLAEVTEIHFETSFDRQQAPHTVGLVFGRMTRSLKQSIASLRDACFRERMQLYFRPLGEDGLGISLIVRESLFIANSEALAYDCGSFLRFTENLYRGERLILTAYQRDREGNLRLVTDSSYDPYFVPVHYFRTAQMQEA